VSGRDACCGGESEWNHHAYLDLSGLPCHYLTQLTLVERQRQSLVCLGRHATSPVLTAAVVATNHNQA
jgi:hypothetical protein